MMKTAIIVFMSMTLVMSACTRVVPLGDAPTPVPRTATVQENVHLLFGNPSNAGTDANNYLVVKRVGAYSYNNSRGSANWASWRTTKNDLGIKILRPDFEPDPSLPREFTRITTFDYSRTGYDRGHLIPSADRWGDPVANRETFQMTNIVPQESELNQFPWEKLERRARSWARWKFDVYNIAGCYGEQDRLRGRVSVPTNCWKVLILLPRGDGLDSVDERTLVVAVDMPNREGIASDGWEKYRTTVRAIEDKTGYDLLSGLPRKIQDAVETRIEVRSP